MNDDCPVCAHSALRIFLTRERVPVHQNVPAPSAAAAREAPRGDLRLACCERCGFISNVAFDARLIAYGAGYENDQSFSSLFDAHMAAMARRLVDECGVRAQKVVEVGCGQGQFLARVCEAGQNEGFGFDPAYRGPSRAGPVTLVAELYGAAHATLHADVVVSRHVIEHVPRPLQLLTAVQQGLSQSPQARCFFETPDVEWILRRFVLQDFFYEHCSYFTASSLTYAFAQAGFEATSVKRVFGDQYLWLEARHGASSRGRPFGGEVEATVAAAEAFTNEERERSARLRDRLNALSKQGPVAVWGAGAKGVTYLNLLDPGGELVDCVVDINPRKQDRFLPGSGHPIVAPSALATRHTRTVIVMNPNYLSEIEAEARTHSPDVTVLPDGES